MEFVNGLDWTMPKYDNICCETKNIKIINIINRSKLGKDAKLIFVNNITSKSTTKRLELIQLIMHCLIGIIFCHCFVEFTKYYA